MQKRKVDPNHSKFFIHMIFIDGKKKEKVASLRVKLLVLEHIKQVKGYREDA